MLLEYELVNVKNLRLHQIDLSLGFINVIGKGRKERYIPFGQYAQEALQTYIKDGRRKLLDKTTNRNRLCIFKCTRKSVNDERYLLYFRKHY